MSLPNSMHAWNLANMVSTFVSALQIPPITAVARSTSLLDRQHSNALPAGAEQSCLLSAQEIQDCARHFGLTLHLSVTGPLYRVTAKHPGEDEPIGYTSGFLVPPLKLAHLDTMQVRRRYWKQLKGSRRFPYGCGVLLGALAMRHAYDSGCRKAELLAINDDPRTHATLRKLYRIGGFVEVKEVRQQLQDIPHLLVWGGEGTRMDVQIEDFLRRWRTLVVSRGNVFTT